MAGECVSKVFCATGVCNVYVLHRKIITVAIQVNDIGY